VAPQKISRTAVKTGESFTGVLENRKKQLGGVAGIGRRENVKQKSTLMTEPRVFLVLNMIITVFFLHFFTGIWGSRFLNGLFKRRLLNKACVFSGYFRVTIFFMIFSFFMD